MTNDTSPWWQEEFPVNDEVLYLNHAAVAPWPARPPPRCSSASICQGARSGRRQQACGLRSAWDGATSARRVRPGQVV